jgi:hypothetical protein
MTLFLVLLKTGSLVLADGHRHEVLLFPVHNLFCSFLLQTCYRDFCVGAVKLFWVSDEIQHTLE